MTLNDLANLGQIIGALAVVISLRRFRKRRESGSSPHSWRSLLFAERISKMARWITRAAAVARLGACHHEPRMRTRWQDIPERASLDVWR
jgi:hypothetical protein